MTEQIFEKELAARKIEAIPGLMEFDIPVRGDNRGWFKENFQKEKMLPLGFPESFFAEGKLQNNISFSRKNVLRGLHAEPWDKYISVADEGKVLGTWVDLREGDSFGNTYQTVIDASKGIFVPRGVANGFQVLTDKVAYTYLVNDYWALELKPKYAFVNYADPSLDIRIVVIALVCVVVKINFGSRKSTDNKKSEQKAQLHDSIIHILLYDAILLHLAFGIIVLPLHLVFLLGQLLILVFQGVEVG